MATVNYLEQSFSVLFWQDIIDFNAALIPVPLGAVSGSLSGFAFENVDGSYTVVLGTDIEVGNVAPISGSVTAIIRRSSLDPFGFDYAVITDLFAAPDVPFAATAVYEAFRGGGTELFASLFFDDDHVVIESPASLGPLQQSPLIETYGGDDIIFGSIYADTIYAGGGDDVIQADGGDDIIYGGNGNDHISGSGGVDSIVGQWGNDFVNGGDGGDLIAGGPGQDELHGANGRDEIHGGEDGDTITGDDGNDTIYGDEGDDRLFGSRGADDIFGGDGSDTIEGNDGRDLLIGQAGSDEISGGSGNDVIYGGDGWAWETDIHPARDFLHGNEGDDQIFGEGGDDLIWGGSGNDTIDGGEGADNAYYNRPRASYDIEFNDDGTVDITDLVGDGGHDELTSIERIIFTDGVIYV